MLCATVRWSSFHDVALQLEDEDNTFSLAQDRLQWSAVISHHGCKGYAYLTDWVGRVTSNS